MAPNHADVFAPRPDVLAAWQQLNGAIKATMDLRRYELVTLAAAKRLRSSYCMLAHGSVLAEQFVSQDALRAIATDHRSAGLDEVDVAVMDFAERVVDDAAAITDADRDALKAHGLDDTDVLDVVLAAAARCFFSKVLDATGTQADAHYAELPEPLRDVLVVGRPISPS